MKKSQISGDDNYVDFKWSQILRQQPDWWLKKLAGTEYKSKQRFPPTWAWEKKSIFSVICSTLHFLRGANFVLIKAAGVVYFQNSKYTSLFNENSLNINILFVNWIYWMNNSYVAQSNDSKGGGHVLQMQTEAKG